MKKLWLAALMALAPFALNAQTLNIRNATNCAVSFHVYADPACAGGYYNATPMTIGPGVTMTLDATPGAINPPGFSWFIPPPPGSEFDIFKVIISTGAVVGQPCTPWPLNDVFQCGQPVFVNWSTITPRNYLVYIHY